MLWCCVTRERAYKTGRVMQALGAGWDGEARVIVGSPPSITDPFVVMTQKWLTLSLLPQAQATNQPHWHVDNGYVLPARGSTSGYYRIAYRGMSPILLADAPRERMAQFAIDLKPWRRNGRHILFAEPGMGFGEAYDLNMQRWTQWAADMVDRITDRPMIVRPKGCPVPLSEHLRDCWALVTHSSNVAVDAALAGIPVFVAPGNPAAPVGNLSLSDLECPAMPDRDAWLASLLCQQYTIGEMKDGTACRYMRMVEEQVDR